MPDTVKAPKPLWRMELEFEQAMRRFQRLKAQYEAERERVVDLRREILVRRANTP